MNAKKKAAVFLDRDGTINFDPGYLSQAKQFRFLPKVRHALRMLSEIGLELFVISNQSGIGRGLITRESAENAAIGLVASFNRGLALGVEDSHGKGAFVEFTSLSEQGGIIETPEGRYAANLENGRIFEVARELGNRMTRIQVTGNYQEYDAWYRHSVSNLPKTMKEKFLPQLKKMPKDFFPYYRLRFSPGI